MAILHALGLRAVGLKRRLPLQSFVSWFLGRGRVHNKFRLRPIYAFSSLTIVAFVVYGHTRGLAPILLLQSMALDVYVPVVGMPHRLTTYVTEIIQSFTPQTKLQQHIFQLEEKNNYLLQKNRELQQELFIHHQANKAHPRLGSTFAESFQVETLNAPDYGQALFLRSKRTHPLHPDHIILGAKGLIGRILLVGERSAKVVTLFDTASRVPIDINGVQGIAAGQGKATLRLTYIKEGGQNQLTVGDLAVTSGFGGIYPKGIPVGHITRMENGVIEITPLEDNSPFHIVNVMEPAPSLEEGGIPVL